MAAARRGGLTALAAVIAASAAWLALPRTAAAHGAPGAPPPTDPWSIATAWVVEPFVIAGILATGALYLLAVRRVDREHPEHPWPRHRTAFLLIGLAGIVAALLSPIDSLADDLASVHMVQHSLLTFVAAPFLVASGVVTLVLRVASHGQRERWILPFLHSRIVRAVTFPLVGWLGFMAVQWGTHWSGLYNAALLDGGIHVFEHTLFFGVAILFWIPIFSPDPSPWRMGHPARLIYLLAQMPSMSFLGVTILNATTVLYPAYLGRSIAFGLDPLADQQLSGAIMWGVGDGVFILAMGLVIWDWMKRDAVETVRVDARLARDDSERAAIDARADVLAAAKATGSAKAGSAEATNAARPAGSAAAAEASAALSTGSAAGGSTP